MSELYNQDYYKDYSGNDYSDQDVWMQHFGQVADRIIADMNPKTVLDAGCAFGYLVSALRDRGVEAYGIDISNYAISQVREDMKQYCAAASLTDELPSDFPKKFDLITNIEVLEHLYEEEGLKAIRNLCSRADCILFSSTPNDISEATHVNVQQSEYWVRCFAENGFFNQVDYMPNYISSAALYFRKNDNTARVVENYQRHLRQCTAKFEDERNSRSEEIKQLNELLTIKGEQIIDLSETDELEDKGIELDVKNRIRHKIFHNSLTGIIKKTYRSLKDLGFRTTYHKIKNKLMNKEPLMVSSVHKVRICELANLDSLKRICKMTGHPIEAIPSIYTEEKVKRLNLVTDSISKESLAGGIATALIVATEFVNLYGYELRIITRTTPADPKDYENIMKMSGIKAAKLISYYSDFDRDAKGKKIFKLEVSRDDIFFATSWWSASAIKETSLRKKFFYILQEVETFFYPHGDEHYLCSRIMKDEDIDFIINSHFLYDYFKTHEPNVVNNGSFFEPAFPQSLYRPEAFIEKSKYKLFFYARPNNPRNLFAYGVNLLGKAISTGVLNTEEWDIYCAGQRMPLLKFSNGYMAKNMGQLSWQGYGKFLGDVDLAVSLMYTPHPSYPPFDAACSGAVVVSNKYSNKVVFEQSRNVILSDLSENEFLKSLEEGILLAKNMEVRKANFEMSSIPRDWAETLTEVMIYMGEKLIHVQN